MKTTGPILSVVAGRLRDVELGERERNQPRAAASGQVRGSPDARARVQAPPRGVLARRSLAIWESAVDLVLPAACAGCGRPGAACCGECRALFAKPAQVVRGPTAGLAPVYALARYADTARRIVLAYKERGRRDLAGALGQVFAEALPYLPGAEAGKGAGWVLVPVPSRRTASRVRGGPHLRRLTRSCAAALAHAGYPAAMAPALRLAAGARDAVGLDRDQRAANLAGRLRLDPHGRPPPGMPVVLLDDVITTGATAAACVHALAEGGHPVALVLALTATR